MHKVTYVFAKNPVAKSKIFRLDTVRLVPGVNELSDEEFKALKAHGDYQAYVDCGCLVVEAPAKKPEKPAATLV